MAVHMLDWSQ